MASLSCYDEVLFEDYKMNAMTDQLELFDSIINNQALQKTSMILFLNKKDLFAESIREGVPLSICFSAENGWNGTQWDEEKHPSYRPMEVKNDSDREIDKNLFEKSYKAALEFITNIYLSYNPVAQKRVFVHVTDATDRDHIERVFMDVQDIVIRANLKRGGFI